MSPAAVSALAALGGSCLGALAPVLSSYVLQVGATRRDLVNRDVAARQKLYGDFIREAARLHADAMTRSSCDLKELVGIYSLVSQIRLIASEPVTAASERTVKAIVERYGKPNASFEDLQSSAVALSANPLQQFSVACRRELQKMTHLGS